MELSKKFQWADPQLVNLLGESAATGECLNGPAPTPGNSQCTDGSSAAGAGPNSGCSIGSHALGQGCNTGNSAGGAGGCLAGNLG